MVLKTILQHLPLSSQRRLTPCRSWCLCSAALTKPSCFPPMPWVCISCHALQFPERQRVGDPLISACVYALPATRGVDQASGPLSRQSQGLQHFRLNDSRANVTATAGVSYSIEP